MNNREILKECKIAYEIIFDLIDNSELLNRDDIEYMYRCANVLDKIYSKAYENGEENGETFDCDIKTKCVRCNGELVISDLIGYAYTCKNCDENLYVCEGDTGYAWWEE